MRHGKRERQWKPTWVFMYGTLLLVIYCCLIIPRHPNQRNAYLGNISLLRKDVINIQMPHLYILSENSKIKTTSDYNDQKHNFLILQNIVLAARVGGSVELETLLLWRFGQAQSSNTALIVNYWIENIPNMVDSQFNLKQQKLLRRLQHFYD